MLLGGFVGHVSKFEESTFVQLGELGGQFLDFARTFATAHWGCILQSGSYWFRACS